MSTLGLITLYIYPKLVTCWLCTLAWFLYWLEIFLYIFLQFYILLLIKLFLQEALLRWTFCPISPAQANILRIMSILFNLYTWLVHWPSIIVWLDTWKHQRPIYEIQVYCSTTKWICGEPYNDFKITVQFYNIQIIFKDTFGGYTFTRSLTSQLSVVASTWIEFPFAVNKNTRFHWRWSE